MVQPYPSSITFVSPNRCLRNVWESCSQRHSLSHTLNELILKSTEIPCLDTTGTWAGAQNPEEQCGLRGPSVPLTTGAKQNLNYFFSLQKLEQNKIFVQKAGLGACIGASLGNGQVLCLPLDQLLRQRCSCSRPGDYRGKCFGRLLRPRAARQHLLSHQSSVWGSTEVQLPLW